MLHFVGGSKHKRGQTRGTQTQQPSKSRPRPAKRNQAGGRAPKPPGKIAGLSKRAVGVLAFVLGALVAVPVDRFGPVLLDQLLSRTGNDLIWPT